MIAALEHGARRHPVAEPPRRRGRREERRGRRAGAPRARGRGPRRGRRAARGGRQGEGGDALRHARAVQPRQGRTPPCTDAIVAAKVARVVIGCRDPNPHVAGGGVESCAPPGSRSSSACREAEARGLIAPWSKFVTTGLPYVSLKLALSLDGRIATRTGASKWVTGPEARARVHALRARARRGRDRHRHRPRRRPAAHRARRARREPAARRLRHQAAPAPARAPGRDRARGAHAGLCSVDAPSRTRRRWSRAASRSCARRARPRAGSTRRPPCACSPRAASSRSWSRAAPSSPGASSPGAVVDELHAFIAPILLGPRGRPGAVDWAGPDTPAEAPRIAEPAAGSSCGSDAYVHGPFSFPP